MWQNSHFLIVLAWAVASCAAWKVSAIESAPVPFYDVYSFHEGNSLQEEYSSLEMPSPCKLEVNGSKMQPYDSSLLTIVILPDTADPLPSRPSAFSLLESFRPSIQPVGGSNSPAWTRALTAKPVAATTRAGYSGALDPRGLKRTGCLVAFIGIVLGVVAALHRRQLKRLAREIS